MLELKPLSIVLTIGRDIIYAIATPFQSEDFICYHIYTPDKTFTIKPNKTGSDHLKWTDLHGNESELYSVAGKALEACTTF